MKDLIQEMFFGFVAIAMLLEFLGGDLYCLLFALDRVMEILEISDSLARRHIMTVAIWNLMSGTGAALVFFTIRKSGGVRPRRWGILLTVAGLVFYAIYRFWFAAHYVGGAADYVQSVSLIYAAFGLAAAWLGRSLWAEDWQPEQPVQRNPYDTTRRLNVPR